MWLLCQHYDLATRSILLLGAMCLNYFVHVKNFANLDRQCAMNHLADELLKRHCLEILLLTP
jgi:hypothetical protein